MFGRDILEALPEFGVAQQKDHAVQLMYKLLRRFAYGSALLEWRSNLTKTFKSLCQVERFHRVKRSGKELRPRIRWHQKSTEARSQIRLQ